MSAQTTPTDNRSRANSITDLSGNVASPAKKKFLNGWAKEQENLMAEWADKAGCYRWLHDRCEKKYSSLNMSITIPVIILSTLTGTANFALGSFIPPNNPDLKNYVGAGIGIVSIFAGILTTLGNFLRYAQGSEAHRVAGISWGKFQRQIAVELAINPIERIDAMDFLKICRAELDRLIEQSPPIPDGIIAEFEREFKNQPDIKKPEICHGLEHTRVFEDRGARLRMLSGEAALMLMHKKKAMREAIVPDLDRMIKKAVEQKLYDLSGAVTSVMKKPESEYQDDSTDWVKLLRQQNAQADAVLNRIKNRSARNELVRTNTLSEIHIDVLGQGDENANMYLEPGQDGYVEERKT
jgi:hypothetical protein